MSILEEAKRKMHDFLKPHNKTEWPVVVVNDEQYAEPSSRINSRIKSSFLTVDFEEWEMVRRILKIQDLNWSYESIKWLNRFDTSLNVKTYMYKPRNEWAFSAQTDNKAISFTTAHPPNTETIPAYSFLSSDTAGAYFMYLPMAIADEEIAQLVRSYHRVVFSAPDRDNTWVQPQLGTDNKSISLFKAMLSTPDGLSQTTFYHTPSFDFLLDNAYFRTFASNGRAEFLPRNHTTWPEGSAEI